MISREVEAEIVRLHRVERWPVGTIARQLGVHHSVVTRVLGRDGAPRQRTRRHRQVRRPGRGRIPQHSVYCRQATRILNSLQVCPQIQL